MWLSMLDIAIWVLLKLLGFAAAGKPMTDAERVKYARFMYLSIRATEYGQMMQIEPSETPLPGEEREPVGENAVPSADQRIYVDANKFEHLLNCIAQLNFTPQYGPASGRQIIQDAYNEAREVLRNPARISSDPQGPIKKRVPWHCPRCGNLIGE